MRLFAIALMVAGCGSMHNHLQRIPSPEFSESWGCDGERTAEGRRMALDAQRTEFRQPYLPQPGWNACRVLMELGTPRDIGTQQSAYGRAATWWYGSAMDPIMVTLQEKGGRWIVDFVGT